MKKLRHIQVFAALLIIGTVFLSGFAFAQGTPAGVSTDCLNDATGKFKTCVDGCKGRSDAFNCCGECDTEFSTTFQNCCNDHCKVDNPPASCSDDSGPGCAGGAVDHPQHPSWCSEETGLAAPHRGGTVAVFLVVPADRRPGDLITGRLVDRGDRFKSMPGLSVIAVNVPVHEGHRGGAVLRGIVVDTHTAKNQPGGRPITMKVPAAPSVPNLVPLTDRPTQ